MEAADVLRQRLLDSLKRKREQEDDIEEQDEQGEEEYEDYEEEDYAEGDVEEAEEEEDGEVEDGEILDAEPLKVQPRAASSAPRPAPFASRETVPVPMPAFPPQPWYPPVPMPAWSNATIDIDALMSMPRIQTPELFVPVSNANNESTSFEGAPRLTLIEETRPAKGRKLGKQRHAALVIELDSDASDAEEQAAEAKQAKAAAAQVSRSQADQRLKTMEAEIARATALIREKEQQALERASTSNLSTRAQSKAPSPSTSRKTSPRPHQQEQQGLQGSPQTQQRPAPQPQPQPQPLVHPQPTPQIGGALPDIAQAMLKIGQVSQLQFQRKRQASQMQNGYSSQAERPATAPEAHGNLHAAAPVSEVPVAPWVVSAAPLPSAAALPVLDPAVVLAASEEHLQKVKLQQDENDRTIYMQQRTLGILQSKNEALHERRAGLAQEESQAVQQLAGFKAQMEQLRLEMEAFELRAAGVSQQRSEIDQVISSSQQVQADLQHKIDQLVQKRAALREQVASAQNAAQAAQALQNASISHIMPGRVAASHNEGPESAARALRQAKKDARRAKRARKAGAAAAANMPAQHVPDLAEVFSNSPNLTEEEAIRQAQLEEEKRRPVSNGSQDPRATVSYASLHHVPPPSKLRKFDSAKANTGKAASVMPDSNPVAVQPPSSVTKDYDMTDIQTTDAHPNGQGIDLAAQARQTVLPHQLESLPIVQPASASLTLPQPNEETGPPPIYTSPLHIFKAYKYHQEFSRTMQSSYRSKTYFHKIKSDQMFCETESLGGRCADANCTRQHFSKVTMTDDEILVELTSATPVVFDSVAEKQAYRESLRDLLKRLRDERVDDFQRVSIAIVQHRRARLPDLTASITSVHAA